MANLDVVNALGEACEHLGFRYGYGIMYSPSSLYIGQGRKLSEQGYWPSSAQHLIDDLRQAAGCFGRIESGRNLRQILMITLALKFPSLYSP